MDDFIESEPEVAERMQSNFVSIKVNVSEDNENSQFMSQFDPVAGYPHFFVLDAGGALLHSQDTVLLEEGRGYNKAVFLTFLDEWGP